MLSRPCHNQVLSAHARKNEREGYEYPQAQGAEGANDGSLHKGDYDPFAIASSDDEDPYDDDDRDAYEPFRPGDASGVFDQDISGEQMAQQAAEKMSLEQPRCRMKSISMPTLPSAAPILLRARSYSSEHVSVEAAIFARTEAEQGADRAAQRAAFDEAEAEVVRQESEKAQARAEEVAQAQHIHQAGDGKRSEADRIELEDAKREAELRQKLWRAAEAKKEASLQLQQQLEREAAIKASMAAKAEAELRQKLLYEAERKREVQAKLESEATEAASAAAAAAVAARSQLKKALQDAAEERARVAEKTLTDAKARLALRRDQLQREKASREHELTRLKKEEDLEAQRVATEELNKEREKAHNMLKLWSDQTFAELTGRLSRTGQTEPAWKWLLKMVYSEFPPRKMSQEKQTKMIEKISNEIETGTKDVLEELKRAKISFHPDRNRAGDFGVEWEVRAGEISKLINACHSALAGREPYKSL